MRLQSNFAHMAQITIRKLDHAVMQALHKRAAAAGRSVEEDARRSLAVATGVDRGTARARLAAVHEMLRACTDAPAENLVREMGDGRTRELSG